MGNFFNRGRLKANRKHFRIQAGAKCIAFDRSNDTCYSAQPLAVDHSSGFDATATAETAYMWRLPGTVKVSNYIWGGNGFSMANQYFADSDHKYYGETPQSVAFWVKPYGNPNNPGNVPVAHATMPTVSDTWRTIWRSSDHTGAAHCGIWVAVFSDASAGKNYFMMAKGIGATGNSGKAHRVGTTTEIADQTGTYPANTPLGAIDSGVWFHVACSWESVDQNNGWKMWVNGTPQTNAFDTSNPAYRNTEADIYTYCPTSNYDLPSATTANPPAPGGAWNKRTNNPGPGTHLGMSISDFGYWHSSLTDDDVTALYNGGVRAGRSAPTVNF